MFVTNYGMFVFTHAMARVFDAVFGLTICWASVVTVSTIASWIAL